MSGDPAATFATARAEFAALVRSRTPQPLDAAHGLHLQRLVLDAESQLRR
jgi:hypothetical protein